MGKIQPTGEQAMIIAPTTGIEVFNLHQHQPGIQRFLASFALSPERPSLQALQKIIAAFSHLPYENLSKIIKFNQYQENQLARLRLPEEVIEDHLRLHTGGTCFSLTFFLQCILLHRGFSCYIVMGDMKAGRNVHCALIVTLDEIKYLVDPGYVLHRPMALDPARPRLYHTELNGVELRCDPRLPAYDLYTFTRADMKWRYRLQDRATPEDEFLSHWQASFHRNSMHGLCLTRVHEHELIFILKDFMRVTSFAGKRNVNLKHSLPRTINEVFGIAPEYVEQALSALRENLAHERRADNDSCQRSQAIRSSNPAQNSENLFSNG
ncbi:MAG: arylamine N-acetyltransferase [bacterium]